MKIPPFRTLISSRPLITTVLVILLLFLGALSTYSQKKSHQNLLTAVTAPPDSTLETVGGVTNILFLGYGGEGHEAPELTDSMILISLRHSDHSVRLISIPRDIWSDTLNAKLNSAYHTGNSQGAGQGLALSKKEVSTLLGVPVNYTLALDFTSFVRLIDAVGGIDVDVPRTLDDYQYPIPGQEKAEPESARYEHLHFEKGLTHMDGKTALKYSRSRHAAGDEGTDFDRSTRQQLILSAFEQKLISSQTLLSPSKIQDIFSSVKEGLVTDIGDAEFTAFLKYFLAYSKAGGAPRVVELSSQFKNPKDKSPYGGQWVLIPARGISEVQSYVAKSLAE